MVVGGDASAGARLGSVGISGMYLRDCDRTVAAAAAAELEERGFGAIWLPGRDPGDLEERLRTLLAATQEIVISTGILSIWALEPAAAAALQARLRADFPGRFLLGLGVGHAEHVGPRYRKPLVEMAKFLDGLDAAAPPAPPTERVLASSGPKSLVLARERALGTHPYLVTVDQTRGIREVLGPEPLLAPAITVVVEPDLDTAKDVARAWLRPYLARPNYAGTILRGGLGSQDLEGGGSDGLLDALVAWRGVDSIRDRIDAHLAAGADHVSVQVVQAGQEPPLERWRRVAAALCPALASA